MWFKKIILSFVSLSITVAANAQVTPITLPKIYKIKAIPVASGQTLADMPGLTCAYSIRKVRDSYTGPCIRVRRSSDNQELDIPFNQFGEIDVNALQTFGINTDVELVTWYDQIGSNNLVSTNLPTSLLPPKIMENGVLERSKVSGKIQISFGQNQSLRFNTQIVTQNFNLFLVTTNSNHSAYHRIFYNTGDISADNVTFQSGGGIGFDLNRTPTNPVLGMITGSNRINYFSTVRVPIGVPSSVSLYKRFGSQNFGLSYNDQIFSTGSNSLMIYFRVSFDVFRNLYTVSNKSYYQEILLFTQNADFTTRVNTVYNDQKTYFKIP